MVKPIDPRKRSHTAHQCLKLAQLHYWRLIARIRMDQPICVQLSAKPICAKLPAGVPLAESCLREQSLCSLMNKLT